MTGLLDSKQRNAVSRIGGLTIVNAMVFQEVLSAHDQRVVPLRKSLSAGDPLGGLCDHWQFIVEKIDYVPIFKIARELLLALSANPDIEEALKFMGHRALDIVRLRAALRHDLMGRVYHRLLVEAKFLGTYYTSVPAATLLLKVALAPQLWNRDWTNPNDNRSFRIGDLACGTGTLLMAAAETMSDNYVRQCAAKGQRLDLRGLHKILVEDVIYGYDVLPSALHLTASTLALRASDVAFEMTNLYSLPLGGPHRRLGSVEFLKDRLVPITLDLFGALATTGQVTGKGDVQQNASLPDLDLCVMNPPFTRSVGGNLLFGSVPDAERKPMQKELSRLLRNPLVLASSTAGLGSVFVAIGDRALKEEGRMALVLPKALLSGVAWEKTRRLFGQRYQLEYLIASHDPLRWNFSENTDLSEVLVVAKKTGASVRPEQGVVCLNLWQNPTTAFEALNVAQTLMSDDPPDLRTGQGALEARIGAEKAGEAISIPWGEVRDNLWMLPCSFAQSNLVRAAYFLGQGDLYLPGQEVVQGGVPLCQLKQLGKLGPDVRDIHDGFSLSAAPTAYPAFWNHDAPKCTTMAQMINRYLSPLPQKKEKRPLRKVGALWPKAGRIVLAERLRLNTQRLAAVRLDRKALSNVWWPFALLDDNEEVEKALVLWLNSTLGLLMLLSHREETEGAWMKFKKPTLGAMPVLDIRALDAEQRAKLAAAFDRLSKEEILPFPFMAEDPVRAEIDRVVVEVLGLPDYAVLREMLSREPVVCLRRLV